MWSCARKDTIDIDILVTSNVQEISPRAHERQQGKDQNPAYPLL